MSAKALFVVKTLLEYGLLGPLFGGAFVVTVLSCIRFDPNIDAIVLEMVAAYVCGLLPALITGIYVIVKTVRSRPIHLRTYYGFAAFFSLSLNPFFVVQLFKDMDSITAWDEELIFVTLLPLFAGLIAAFLVLKLVSKQFAGAAFSLKFFPRKSFSSPAVTEV